MELADVKRHCACARCARLEYGFTRIPNAAHVSLIFSATHPHNVSQPNRVKFIDFEDPPRALRCLLLTTFLLYVPLLVTSIVSCITARTFDVYLESMPFRLFGWYNIFTLVLLAVTMLYAGGSLQARMCTVLGNDEATNTARYYAVRALHPCLACISLSSITTHTHPGPLLLM